MKKHPMFGVALLVLGVPLCLVAQEQDPDMVNPLLRYPHPPLLDLRDHTDAAGLQEKPATPKRLDAPVIVTTWFPRKTPYSVPMGCAEMSSVDVQGNS